MSTKFLLRTARSLLWRNRPYFAHLALTHRCNLRCHFCQIPQQKIPEQDTEGMKRIIDRLDELGVAVLSISGGGEPLLRPDFATIIDYASGKGMYTKITSNGTMPTKKYEELLASRVDEIGISLDGVRGNELPYAHVGPKILDSVRYLNDHLPPGKHLTLNVTISNSNREQVPEIVEYCSREFLRARVWLNPVVVGQGMLRVGTELKVDPGIMRSVKSPTLLNTDFYRKACEEYARRETYNWGCLAGEAFFDIKPNGDFWICQDHPAKEPLNILDSDFKEKYRKTDFSYRRACGGCTYSCYFLVQKAFEPAHWPAMAVMWWLQSTQPDEVCRRTAQRWGWIAGLAHYLLSRLLRRSKPRRQAAPWPVAPRTTEVRS